MRERAGRACIQQLPPASSTTRVSADHTAHATSCRRDEARSRSPPRPLLQSPGQAGVEGHNRLAPPPPTSTPAPARPRGRIAGCQVRSGGCGTLQSCSCMAVCRSQADSRLQLRRYEHNGTLPRGVVCIWSRSIELPVSRMFTGTYSPLNLQRNSTRPPFWAAAAALMSRCLRSLMKFKNSSC